MPTEVASAVDGLVWTPSDVKRFWHDEEYEVRLGNFVAKVRKVNQEKYHTPAWSWYVGMCFKYARGFDDFNGCSLASAEGHVDTIEQAKTAALAALATALFIDSLVPPGKPK